MPWGLKRFYGAGDLHFITTSCYRRQPLLAPARHRDLFVRVLEEIRQRYQFVLVGYVVMPEHFHLLMSEPGKANPSVVIQALKLGVARRVLAANKRREKRKAGQGELWPDVPPQHFWQARFYDYNVWTRKKSGLKSYATFIATRSGEAWWKSLNSGAGAVFAHTPWVNPVRYG